MDAVDQLNDLLGIGPAKPKLPLTLQRSGYSAVKSLGRGSFGEAYLLYHTAQKKYFVAKHINLAVLSHKSRKDAHNEIQIIQQLQHPNIVRYVEYCEEHPHLYIIMEYADGGDLYTHLKKIKSMGQNLSEEQILNLFTQIVMAVHYMHEQRVLHRDIKAQNVFLTKAHVVKLGDFGISTVLQHTMQLAKTMCGTPCYFSPELCSGKPYNNKSDVWALGILLFEMCALRLPFETPNIKRLMEDITRHEPPRIPATYSDSLWDLICRMLQKDPAKRPDTAALLRSPLLINSGPVIAQKLKEHLTPAAAAPPSHSPNSSPPAQLRAARYGEVQYGMGQPPNVVLGRNNDSPASSAQGSPPLAQDKGFPVPSARDLRQQQAVSGRNNTPPPPPPPRRKAEVPPPNNIHSPESAVPNKGKPMHAADPRQQQPNRSPPPPNDAAASRIHVVQGGGEAVMLASYHTDPSAAQQRRDQQRQQPVEEHGRRASPQAPPPPPPGRDDPKDEELNQVITNLLRTFGPTPPQQQQPLNPNQQQPIPSSSPRSELGGGGARFEDPSGLQVDIQGLLDSPAAHRCVASRSGKRPKPLGDEQGKGAGPIPTGAPPPPPQPQAAEIVDPGGLDDDEDIPFSASCICGGVTLASWLSLVFGSFTCRCPICVRFSGASAGVEWLHLPSATFPEVVAYSKTLRFFSMSSSPVVGDQRGKGSASSPTDSNNGAAYFCSNCGASVGMEHPGIAGCVISKGALDTDSLAVITQFQHPVPRTD